MKNFLMPYNVLKEKKVEPYKMLVILFDIFFQFWIFQCHDVQELVDDNHLKQSYVQ